VLPPFVKPSPSRSFVSVSYLRDPTARMEPPRGGMHGDSLKTTGGWFVGSVERERRANSRGMPWHFLSMPKMASSTSTSTTSYSGESASSSSTSTTSRFGVSVRSSSSTRALLTAGSDRDTKPNPALFCSVGGSSDSFRVLQQVCNQWGRGCSCADPKKHALARTRTHSHTHALHLLRQGAGATHTHTQAHTHTHTHARTRTRTHTHTTRT
jgi:hypothetical protein